MQNGLELNIRYYTIKLLEDNIGKTFSDINHTNTSLGQSSKAIETKIKISQWDLNKLKHLYSKGNHKLDEKTTYGLGENIANDVTEKSSFLQNIQISHTSQ